MNMPRLLRRIVTLLIVPMLALGPTPLQAGVRSNFEAFSVWSASKLDLTPAVEACVAAQALMLPATGFNSPSRSARRWLVQAWRRDALKNTLTGFAMLSPFFLGIAIDYFGIRDKADHSVFYEYLSFAVLAGLTAVSGSLMAQWRRIRKGTQKRIEILPILYLTGLALFYSTPVEKWLWDLLETLRPFSSSLANAVLQTAVDFFGLSLFLATAWALFFYARNFDPRKETDALEEIQTKFLGFYLKHEWKWAGWIFLAMLSAPLSKLLSYTFFQAGVLNWNVNFDEGDYPDSWEKIREVERHPYFWWLSPPLRLIQKGLEHAGYIHYLKNTLAAGVILAVGSIFQRSKSTSDFAPGLMIAAAFAWSGWVLRAQLRKTRPLRARTWMKAAV
jgi:hypothetical protein